MHPILSKEGVTISEFEAWRRLKQRQRIEQARQAMPRPPSPLTAFARAIVQVTHNIWQLVDPRGRAMARYRERQPAGPAPVVDEQEPSRSPRSLALDPPG